MRKRNKILLGLLIVCLLAAATVVSFLAPYMLRVQYFPAESAKGYQAGFYLYVSPGARRRADAGQTVTFLVQPNNSGTNSDDPAVHQRDAWLTGFERQAIADELQVVLLVPAFVRPGEDWHILTHALDRDTLTTARPDLARLDLQLLAMIDQARAALLTQGIPSDEQFLLQGFSASGMFANRFAILHPQRVKAVTIGSPGGWPLAPVAEFAGEPLPYPAGIADLQELTGQPFDLAAYQAVPQLIYMGTLDDNDSLDYTDGWDKEAAAQVDRLFGADPLTRWPQAEALYRSAGANVHFLLVEGVGHDRKALQTVSTQFFADVLNASN